MGMYPGIVYGSAAGRLYQLSGMLSYPALYVNDPLSPDTAKNDLKVSLSRYPSGYCSEWFAVIAGGKAYPVGETKTPAN